MRTRIYVAGPISKGDIHANVRQALDAGGALLRAGYAPLVPHLTCYFDGSGVPKACPSGFQHSDWLASDLPWVAVSDAVLRLPGESAGADEETALAASLGIPVFSSLDALFNSLPPERPGKAGDPRFHAIIGEMARLHSKKAADYGRGQDPLANIRASAEFGIAPWLGAAMRLNDKVHRLKSFAQNGTLANEGVEDSLLDIACYAILALVLFREGAAHPSSPAVGAA